MGKHNLWVLEGRMQKHVHLLDDVRARGPYEKVPLMLVPRVVLVTDQFVFVAYVESERLHQRTVFPSDLERQILAARVVRGGVQRSESRSEIFIEPRRGQRTTHGTSSFGLKGRQDELLVVDADLETTGHLADRNVCPVRETCLAEGVAASGDDRTKEEEVADVAEVIMIDCFFCCVLVCLLHSEPVALDGDSVMVWDSDERFLEGRQSFI